MHQKTVKKGQKLLGVLCSLALAAALMPCVAFADEPICSSKFQAPSTETVGETVEVGVYVVGKAGEKVPAGFQSTIEVAGATLDDITSTVDNFKVTDGSFSYLGLSATYDSNGEYRVATLKISASEAGKATITMKDALASVSGDINDKAVTLATAATITFEEPQTTLERLAGENADQTATAISEAGFESSETAILARMDDFADALGASGLAGTLNCPILLTGSSELSEAAAKEMERLGVKQVYIIGGTGALFEQIDDDLNDLGIESTRVWGEYAWDTSLACAKAIEGLGGNENSEAIIAMSSNFQDALSISSYAYQYQVPLILQTDETELTSDAIKFINDTDGTIYVPGGTGAVPESSVEGVFTGRTIQRLWGYDGYDTSNQIASYMTNEGLLSANTVAIASGGQKAHGVDALAGAALVGKQGGVMLLANANPEMEDVNLVTIDAGKDSEGEASFLTANKDDVESAFVLGGTVVAPDSLFTKVKTILGA